MKISLYFRGQKPRTSKAFTLLEVVISTLLIAVCAGAILASVVFAKRAGQNKPLHNQQAYSFALELADDLRRLDYNAAELTIGGPYSNNTANLRVTLPSFAGGDCAAAGDSICAFADNYGGSRTYTVGVGPVGVSRAIQITVNWNESTGETRAETLSFIYFQP